MRLALVHARLEVLELVRFPGFTVATLGFPTFLYLLFGLPRSQVHPALVLASYAAFSVLGVGFFQFGVSIAIERATPWQAWLRTLPASAFARLAGRVLAALLFACGAAGLVVGAVLLTTHASLGPLAWLRLATALLAGSVPFVALGLAIAYWTSPKSALPVANVLYMLLAFTGGLWTGPSDLPGWVRGVSPLTPTRQWGDVLWPAVTGTRWHVLPWLFLGGYGAAFAALAAWGYHRDEKQKFR